jgi:hypothetical protein
MVAYLLSMFYTRGEKKDQGVSTKTGV